jgi:hypothetical protein
MQQLPVQGGAGNSSPNWWGDIGQPAGLDAFSGGHPTIDKPAKDLQTAAYELMMACMRSTDVGAELLPKIKDGYFRNVHVHELELVLRIVKQHIALADADVQVVGQHHFPQQIKRAIETAITLRRREHPDLPDIEFLAEDLRGSQLRKETLDWIFGFPAEEISIEAARGHLKRLAAAFYRERALTHFRFTDSSSPRDEAEQLAKLATELLELDATFDTSRKWWTPEEFAAAKFEKTWLIPGVLVAGQPAPRPRWPPGQRRAGCTI